MTLPIEEPMLHAANPTVCGLRFLLEGWVGRVLWTQVGSAKASVFTTFALLTLPTLPINEDIYKDPHALWFSFFGVVEVGQVGLANSGRHPPVIEPLASNDADALCGSFAV